jgi:D-amino-acid dehydrogenase
VKASADIIVIGGGPVGACCALELAEAGAQVTLLEKETEVCPPLSGAHANCGLLVPSELEPLASPGALGKGLRWLLDGSSPFYIAPRPSPALARWLWMFKAAATPERARAAAPLLHAMHSASADLHDGLAARPSTSRSGDSATLGERWLFRHGGIVQAYEQTAAMDEAEASASQAAREYGLRYERLDPDQARLRFPRLRGRLAGAVFFPDDGHLEPRLFTLEVGRAAAAAGARVRPATEALALDATSSGSVRVITTRGDFMADQVVVAAGAWTPFLAERLGLRLPIEPAKGYSVDVERPADFPDVPLYLGDAHVVLTPFGDVLRLGGTLELSGWDMRVRPRRISRLRDGAERAVGLSSHSPVRQIWRGPRPLTPDGLPVIGRVPLDPRVILATGHCMLGLTLGPVTGRLVCELAGGARPSIDLAPLAPQRFA